MQIYIISIIKEYKCISSQALKSHNLLDIFSKKKYNTIYKDIYIPSSRILYNFCFYLFVLICMIKPRSAGMLSTFRPVTTDEITKIIMNSPAKQCGLDPAPKWLIKQFCKQPAPSIARSCNASFREGMLPMNQKRAMVRPRFKKPSLDPDDLNSYRPISNLSFVLKIIERMVAAWFSEHAKTHQLLPKRHSAYHAYHSTEMAVTAVHNNMVRNVDKSGKVNVLVLLYLSLAFDTVDHKMLLSRT